ncbi:MAG: NADH-quinone oxidoreductase subunit C, partial [bacterium]|nr:NADH-quinone oxidoreductase subunit C [bacterium]
PTRDWVEWIAAKHPESKPEWIIEALASEKAVLLTPEHFKIVCNTLRTNEQARFDQMHCVSGVDRKTHLEVVYHLFAFSRNERLIIKKRIPRDKPETASITDLWPAAEWHEREIYDLFGIIFYGHPDLRRILLPDDWEGHPLLKDYVHAEFYNGMRIDATEPDRSGRPVN